LIRTRSDDKGDLRVPFVISDRHLEEGRLALPAKPSESPMKLLPSALRLALRSGLLAGLVTLAAPAAAQVDAGPEEGEPDAGEPDAGPDGEPDPCDPRCDGDVLLFCDVVTPVALDCVGGPLEGAVRCGELSPAFGADCLLGAGAPCDPDYGFGLSRCDRQAGLFCIDGTCAPAPGPPPVPEPLVPTPGSRPPPTTDVDAGTSCLGCANPAPTSTAALGGALFLLRRRARLLPRRRA
jgi:hypothetical protein